MSTIGHEVRRVPRPTPDVQDVDSLFQRPDDLRCQRQHIGDQGFVEPLGGEAGPEVQKSVESVVGHAPAVPEAVEELVFQVPEQGDRCTKDGHIVGSRSPGQQRRMLCRKNVGLLVGQILDDPARDHRVEPFAHISLVQPRGFRNLFAGRWWPAGHCVEEAGAVTDARHQREHPTVENLHHPSAERLDLRLIQLSHSRTPHCWG
jgi:hypothetical protein